MTIFQIALEHGIKFMETSAKNNINIDRAFHELAEAILNKTSRDSSSSALGPGGNPLSPELQDRVNLNTNNKPNANRISQCC